MNDYYLFSRLIIIGSIKVPEVFCGIILEDPYKEDRRKVKIQKIIDLEKHIINMEDGLGDILIIKASDIYPLPISLSKRYKEFLFMENR